MWWQEWFGPSWQVADWWDRRQGAQRSTVIDGQVVKEGPGGVYWGHWSPKLLPLCGLLGKVLFYEIGAPKDTSTFVQCKQLLSWDCSWNPTWSELVETLAQFQCTCQVHTLLIRTLMLCKHLKLFACSHITKDSRSWFCIFRFSTHWEHEDKVERSEDSGASIEAGGVGRCSLVSSDLAAALSKTLIMELGKFYFRYLELV